MVYATFMKLESPGDNNNNNNFFFKFLDSKLEMKTFW